MFRVKASIWMFDVVGLGELRMSEPQDGLSGCVRWLRADQGGPARSWHKSCAGCVFRTGVCELSACRCASSVGVDMVGAGAQKCMF